MLTAQEKDRRAHKPEGLSGLSGLSADGPPFTAGFGPGYWKTQ